MANRGGIERAASVLVNGLVENGHRVTLLTLERADASIAFNINKTVVVEQLNLNRPASNKLGAIAGILKSIWTLRRTIKRIAPDVVISFQGQLNVMTAIACKGLGIPAIGSERIHPAAYNIGRGWQQLRIHVYPWLSSLVLQTKDGGAWCTEHFDVPVVVIPNPVLPPNISPTREPSERRTAVAAGTLCTRKGFDILIEAFSTLVNTHPNWDLVIYGEGEQRKNLEELVTNKGLNTRITLPGNVENLNKHMVQGDLFILPSLAEGFPNILGEAMALGLPAVAFDCPSGPADIIRHGTDGFLVTANSVEQLVKNMDRLMGDPDQLMQFASKAPDVVERFSLQTVLNTWQNLLDDVTSN